jgi:hypothetical protein
MTDSLSDPVSKKRDYGNSNNYIKPSSGVTERIDEREQLFWFLCFVFIVVSNAILNGIISYYRDTQPLIIRAICLDKYPPNEAMCLDNSINPG